MTATLITEPPPTRLSIHVKTPSGGFARWAADEPDPANKPSGLTIATAMPGGFDTMSCTLARDPSGAYTDTEVLSDVQVRGVGGEIAWEGEMQALPDQGGSGQASVSPQAIGYQDVLNDDSGAAIIYIDQQLTNWGDMPLARQKALLSSIYSIGSSSTAVDPTSEQPALVLEVDDSWTTIIPVAEAWYDSGVAGPIAKVYYAIDLGQYVSDASPWIETVGLSADGNNQVAATNMIGGALVGVYAPGPTGRWAMVEHYYGAANAGTDGFQYTTYWQLAAIGNHGLPIQGSWPLVVHGDGSITGGIGVLASDVAAHAIGKWAPNIAFTTGADGTIQPSSFSIPQLAFTDPGTAATIIGQATGYEMLDWAVWEGPTYWQNPRGQSAKTKNWVTRIKPAQLQETGPSSTRAYNGVIVQYTGVDGNTYTVGPPGSGATVENADLVDTDPENPANTVGPLGVARNRWALVNAGTTTSLGAIQIGQVFLIYQREADNSGQAAAVGIIQDDHGIWYPSWAVRAGDTLSVIDARDSSARRIVSTSYDHDSRTNTLQLDQPPDSMTALLQRLSASIAPFGLS